MVKSFIPEIASGYTKKRSKERYKEEIEDET